MSEANRRDHGAACRKRAKAEAVAVGRVMMCCPRVPLVRVGGKRLDPDNLAGSFKLFRRSLEAARRR